MESISKAVHKLNGSQAPVIAFDQPLYAMAKLIQWSEPEKFGEDQFVLLLGALHIEMAAWKTLGDWLAGSGWTDALEHAGVASSGTADSFLKACHVKRTRQAHIVTLASLYVLRYRAYERYRENELDGVTVLDFQAWCDSRISECPQFAYWNSVFDFELTVLGLVRAIRTRNFDLYCRSLVQLAPWFFALDHTHYARWLPIHIRDMVSLHDRHASVASELEMGNFVVCKSARPFSAIAVDHAHEQANKVIKEAGGAVGLTGNEHALRRWMVAGPEIARMLNEFEAVSDIAHDKHHEQTKSYQSRFVKDVTTLIDSFEQFDNPFVTEHSDLVSLMSRVVVSGVTAKIVTDALDVGKKQYNQFVTERLCERTTSVHAVLKRNSLAPFSFPQVRKSSAHHVRLAAARNDSALFSRLYIASQCRDGDLDTFFAHEN